MPKPRTFKNPNVLHEMIFLRIQGWPLRDLAFKYGCDRTSVRKACLRNGLPPEVNLLPHPVVRFHRVKTDWNGERVNRGKTYKEYLEEAKRRSSHHTFVTIRTSM